MVDIKCLVCKESLEIPPCIDLDNYDGQLFCHECNSLWDIKLKSSKVIKYKLAKQQPKVRPSTIKLIANIPRPWKQKK
jgi:hypothetical protein